MKHLISLSQPSYSLLAAMWSFGLRRRALELGLDRAWQSQLEARLASDRATADLRTLRGIIPIGSFCKQVRTGVSDWQQIERYVQRHTQAEFSHGVCPDCRPFPLSGPLSQ